MNVYVVRPLEWWRVGRMREYPTGLTLFCRHTTRSRRRTRTGDSDFGSPKV